MKNLPNLPYALKDGSKKEAWQLEVPVNISNLSEEELQVVGYLSEAANYFTPIFADQMMSGFSHFYNELLRLELMFPDYAREQLSNYMTILLEQNTIDNPVVNSIVVFPTIDESKLDSFSKEALKYLHSLKQSLERLPGKNVYPKIITEEEFNSISSSLKENMSIQRTEQGNLEIILHEERYKKELQPVMDNLQKAYNVSTNNSLKKYIAAKIKELQSGSQEAIFQSNLARLHLEGPIDFIMGTAIETYDDEKKSAIGFAGAAIFNKTGESQKEINSLIELLPKFELAAPWKHKKNMDSLSVVLNQADVLTWTGEYLSFPGSVMAQSQPNQQEFTNTHGSINLEYSNIQDIAMSQQLFDLYLNAFFEEEEVKPYTVMARNMGPLMTKLHELGHVSGDFITELEPKEVFKEYHTRIEEKRAELCSMWLPSQLVKEKIITPEQEKAGYYEMMVSLISNLPAKPIDHAGARNFLFHYFIDTGSLGYNSTTKKYQLHFSQMQKDVVELLGVIGDIRAEGRVEDYIQLKNKYIRDSEHVKQVRNTLANFPKGRLLIFPNLVKRDGKFTSEPEYPNYRDQPRLLEYHLKNRV